MAGDMPDPPFIQLIGITDFFVNLFRIGSWCLFGGIALRKYSKCVLELCLCVVKKRFTTAG